MGANKRQSTLPALATTFILLLCEVNTIVAALSQDGQALLSLKRSIIDGYGHLSDWNPNDAFPCTWTGIICNTSGFVTGLDLSQLNLTGTISDDIQLLHGLTTLNICCNGFSGFLSSAINNLTNLLYLDLSRNFFLGPFPSGISKLQSMVSFTAYSNNFTGPLPLELSQLSMLEHLDLGGSFFDGSIPPDYGKLGNLKYLGLSGNLLGGKIPAELGNLSQLEHMVIGYNKYDGGIPAELGNLSLLQYMDICCTNLSGSIPAELGKLVSLNTLFLYRNSLTGTIPPELGNMTALMSLDLSVNNLTGSIPDEFGKLQNLTLLSLMYNSLNGSLPSGIGNLQNLLTLLIWNNSFTGSLPQQLGRNSVLEWIDVSSNLFNGSIPEDLCIHGNLTKLILFSNEFSGSIPESLANCPTLLRVRMHDNHLTGPIPRGFTSLPRLTRLELQKNKLSGPFPSDLSNISRLSYLDVSFNSLEGRLPSEIWQLPNIQSFYASANNLSGSIPSEFGSCSFLTVLDLSQNAFTDKIPADMSDCQKLVTIELQQNKLVGSIPRELASMPDLEVLDLSHNGLNGMIPVQFENTTALEAFNVSYNDLSGPVPMEGMFKTASPSSFLGNPGLCGGVLPPCLSSGNITSMPSKFAKKSLGPLAWLVCGIFAISVALLIAGGRCFFKQYGRRICRKEREEDTDEWPWRLTAFQRLPFTSNDILDALKEENIVGRGATGTVYKAEMPSGEVVAVKKLWASHKDAAGSKDHGGFKAEVDLLGSIRHRNIVRLLGYCSNNVNTLLIYEYMRNGNLEEALHAKEKANVLADWVTRYNIAVGIAQGLCYLHHDCFPQVIHRDVKSNNILLDCNMEARVADFGVAKLIEANESMSMIAGSYGYIAPEYAYTLKVDEKTDIYSFGVVLLELLTGRRPIESQYGDAVNITGWVRSKIRSKAGIMEALDTNVGAECSSVQEEMLLVLRIALLCTSRSPRDRPSMRDVVTMLAEAKPRRKSYLPKHPSPLKASS